MGGLKICGIALLWKRICEPDFDFLKRLIWITVELIHWPMDGLRTYV